MNSIPLEQEESTIQAPYVGAIIVIYMLTVLFSIEYNLPYPQQSERHNEPSAQEPTETLQSCLLDAINVVLLIDSLSIMTEALAGLIIDHTIETLSGNESKGPSTTCLYHGPMINHMHVQQDEQLEQAPSAVDRYTGEDSAEQCWNLLHREDGRLSNGNGCTCETVGPELAMSDVDEDEKELGDIDSMEIAVGEYGLIVVGK